MKRASDEALARRIDGAKARIKENPLWDTDRENLAIFEELQAWRAAFKGVKMVVPVEWATDGEVKRLCTSEERVPLVWMLDGEGCKNEAERDLGVIRLDEIFGTEGTK